MESLENILNSSLLMFPILECIHILGFAFSVGTVALVSFRLIGIGITDHSPAELWRDTAQWTLGGLVAVVFSGLLLYASDPDMYYLNYAFLLKMVSLAAAVVFNYTAVRRTVKLGEAPRGKMVGTISLGLWACVAFGGIFIGVLPSTLDLSKI
jgi:hypothetical protein